MADKKYYGWKDGDKYYVSRMPPDAPRRPANVYDSMRDAMTEVGRRGGTIEWADGVSE